MHAADTGSDRRGNPDGITDFHTHAFPDALADRAMRTLLAETVNVTAHLDGRLSSLLASMDRAGIARTVVCSIATKPDQFDKIMAWSAAIASPRVVPFPSVHPRDPAALDRVGAVAAAGFKGLKLHPYYQDFNLDDPALTPFFERIAAERLVLVCHTGFDIAFPRIRKADPTRIAVLLDRVPGMRFVATHMGGWQEWDDVERVLLGRRILMEISYSLPDLPPERARRMLLAHPADCLLFGTDSPWQDQSDELARLRALNLGAAREQAILVDNARRLLA